MDVISLSLLSSGRASLFFTLFSLFSPPFSELIPSRRFSFPSTDELVQHPSLDSALLRFRRLRPAVGGRCRVDRLLAADGGGNRAAAESDHRGQDGAALGPVEGLLCGGSEPERRCLIHPSIHLFLIPFFHKDLDCDPCGFSCGKLRFPARRSKKPVFPGPGRSGLLQTSVLAAAAAARCCCRRLCVSAQDAVALGRRPCLCFPVV